MRGAARVHTAVSQRRRCMPRADADNYYRLVSCPGPGALIPTLFSFVKRYSSVLSVLQRLQSVGMDA